MNVFQNLAKNLIKNPLWTSKVEIIQMRQYKNGTKLVNRIAFSRFVPCVIKKLERQGDDGTYAFYLEFVISSEDLKDFELEEEKIVVEYNGKSNEVEKIVPGGILGNDPTIYSILIRG